MFYFWNILFYLIHVCLFRIFSYLTLFSFTSQADSSTKDLLNSCQGKAPHHLHLLFLWHETKSVHIAPLTASEKQHIRQRRFHSVPPVNHCLHCHNRGLIISVMICLEKQPWGNQSENSQLASQNNFCAPSPDCRMLLQPSVSVIKTFHRLLEQVVTDLYQFFYGFFLLIHGLSGPMRAYVLAREDAIRHWRELMGPTKVFRARYTSPASIRGQFGLTDTRNTTHGSGRECIT